MSSYRLTSICLYYLFFYSFSSQFFFVAFICYNIGPTPDDAKVFGERYCEENDVILAIDISLKFV